MECEDFPDHLDGSTKSAERPSEIASFPPGRGEDERRNHQRLVSDVCSIFRDVTGMPADPLRESGIIVRWAQQHQWQSFDFRLMFEYLSLNAKEAQYFRENPSQFNIRGFLNPSGQREQRLIDALFSLKHQKAMEAARKQQEAPKRMSLIRLRCGAKVPVGDRVSHDQHMKDCFSSRGACYF